MVVGSVADPGPGMRGMLPHRHTTSFVPVKKSASRQVTILHHVWQTVTTRSDVLLKMHEKSVWRSGFARARRGSLQRFPRLSSCGSEGQASVIIPLRAIPGSAIGWRVLYASAGVPGGKFLERGRVKKPTTTTPNNRLDYYNAAPSTHRLDYYNAGDFYVGATLEFNRHRFVLIDADEYAFNYMEQHRDQVCARCLSLLHKCPT